MSATNESSNTSYRCFQTEIGLTLLLDQGQSRPTFINSVLLTEAGPKGPYHKVSLTRAREVRKAGREIPAHWDQSLPGVLQFACAGDADGCASGSKPMRKASEEQSQTLPDKCPVHSKEV